MAWDDEKQVAPGTEEGELTPEEWNEHVDDQKNHSERHESGGVDEITVEGLSGDLADAQDPKQAVVNDFVDALVAGGNNITSTYDSEAGTLTIDTSALDDGEVRDTINDTLDGGDQVTTTYDATAGTLTIEIDAPTQAVFDNHSTRHESGGADELSVTGLSGDLADEQDAKPHDIGGATHTADTLANLNSKVSDATLDDTNDPREPESHAATHEGGSDSLNVFDLTGDLVGEGLERVNDTLQVLSSIWDGTNVVADVNNTNTTTQTLEAEQATIGGQVFDLGFEEIATFDDSLNEGESITISFDSVNTEDILLLDFENLEGEESGSSINLTIPEISDGNYGYKLSDETISEDQDEFEIFNVTSTFPFANPIFAISGRDSNQLSIYPIFIGGRFGRFEYLTRGSTMGSIDSNNFSELTLQAENAGIDSLSGKIWQSTRGE